MNNSGDGYGVVQNEVYGYPAGASSPRESAMKFQQEGDAKQNELNKMFGGFKKQHKLKNRRTNKKRWNGRGGFAPAPGDKLEVPVFTQSGPSISPISNNNISEVTNQLALNSKVAACNDCHVNNTCHMTSGCPSQGGGGGGRRKPNKKITHTRKQPYSISTKRVKKSPFKTVSNVKKTLKAYKKGKKIGFTKKSSLRSMGLIPRSNGVYKLGPKY